MSSNKITWDVTSRYLGNLLSIIGYVTLIHIDSLLGSSLKIIGLMLVTPYCVKTKLWDVIILFSIFGFIDLSNIIKLILNN